MAARGYAVLLPDPALSTGYGHRMIARGWDHWGGKPYTDVMAITDAVVERPDIDQARTAMMGGSYGGYMANWIAGHTDRFKAIVSHAGLWALDQMFGTTDGPPFWRRQFGDPRSEPERYLASSPHLHADKIVTPMLIIHGDKDYRVPVGARHFGCGGIWRSGPSRPGSCTSRTKTTGYSSRATSRFGTPQSWRSSPSMCLATNGSGPTCCRAG